MPVTLLCIATFLKGQEFLRECRRQGCRVLLLTDEKLREADWPREAVDEFFYIRRDMPMADVRLGAAHLARRDRIDRIVALDDFDVELAAMLREHLFIPGMGETTGRAFRDKLAMRRRARSRGHSVSGVRARAQHRRDRRVDGACAAAMGAQAARTGGRDRHPQAARRRRALADDRRTGRSVRRIRARAVRPGDVFHVDSIVFGSAGALRDREPLQHAADGAWRTKAASSRR